MKSRSNHASVLKAREAAHRPPSDGDVDTMEHVVIDDRRSAKRTVEVGERREASSPRRVAPRVRTLKGAQINRAGSVPIRCLVRNISETGARIEIRTPVLSNSFDLVFDDAAWPQAACRVVWRKEMAIGVKFDSPIVMPINPLA